MEISFAERRVGHNHLPYVIAEIGSNHNGDIPLARKMIEEAKRRGADAVKFQSWSTTSLISKAEYARNTTYQDKDRHFGSLYEMVERYQLTPDQHYELAEFCRGIDIHFLSSAFSPEEVQLLVDVDVPAIKIASMDVNHPVLLESAARSGKPIILSTGLSTLSEVAAAVDTLRSNGCKDLIVLHCISVYPPRHEDVNLRNIEMLATALDVPVGFSDHSIGTSLAIASVALGACLIEKHYTMDKNMDGWDHWMSADPDELEAICTETKNVFRALGSRRRIVSDDEIEKRKKFRRCIVIRNAIKAGHVITLDDIDFKRPGTGISPTEYPHVTGRRAARDLDDDHELSWEDIE